MKNIIDLVNLKNRKALVTGCNGPMGLVVSETLAELECSLICVDKPDSNFEKLQKILSKYKKIKFDLLPSDFENVHSRSKFIKKIKDENSSLDILINNAAMTGSSDLKGWNTNFGSQSLDNWQKALEINVIAIFHICRDLSELVSKNKHGTIINISSIYGSCAPDYSLYEGTNINNPAAYAASKGALNQLTKWLAATVAPNIRVNCISPGGIFSNQDTKFVRRYELKTPLKRMANYSDFRGIIAFLSSDMSEYITGQNILIDGGWSI